MNIPSLKTFEVNSKITDFLNRKFEQYKKSFPPSDRYYPKNCFKGDGFQTGNILEWQDDEYQHFLKNECSELIADIFEVDYDYKVDFFFHHMLEYDEGTSMTLHTHDHNEDFVIFIYLNDCNDGQTVFYLNDKKDEFKERTTVVVKPTKNMGVVFHAGIAHEGLPTYEHKKVFVCGIRIDLRTN